MNKLLMFSGAGISAESGLSTFRDAGGLWTKYDINQVCNYTVFKQVKEDAVKRANIFEFYSKVKEAILQAQPNEAHYQVARWQKQYGKDRVRVFTANIDNLFEKAGCEEVIHLHGEIFHMMCAACGHKWNIGENSFNHEDRCPHCDSKLTKPNVVFFYEPAPLYTQLNQEFHLKRRQPDDLILYVGSSMSVIPPSSLIQTHANKKQHILANLDKGEEDNFFGHHYYGKATEQLKLIDQNLIQPQMKPTITKE